MSGPGGPDELLAEARAWPTADPDLIALLEVLAASNARLRRNQELLLCAQRLSLTGSFEWHPATGLMLWSAETYRLFAIEPGVPLTPELVYDRIHPLDERAFRDTVSAAREGAVDIDREFRVKSADEAGRNLHFMIRARRGAEGRLEYIGAIQDVTQQRREEVGRLESELRIAELRSQATHANRLATVGQLSAAISHDVRQPLASVVISSRAGLNWLSGDSPNIEGARRAFERTLAGGLRATEILERTKSFASKDPPSKATVRIDDIIADTIALVEPDAVQRGITIRTDLEAGLAMPCADRSQIRQVVINLLVNAMDAISELDHDRRRVTLATWTESPEEVGIGVCDLGPGVSEGERDRLFEAFYTTKPGGMGTGLAICRDIIEAHGGRLWVAPNEPVGARFTFTLPLEPLCDGRASH